LQNVHIDSTSTMGLGATAETGFITEDVTPCE